MNDSTINQDTREFILLNLAVEEIGHKAKYIFKCFNMNNSGHDRIVAKLLANGIAGIGFTSQ